MQKLADRGAKKREEIAETVLQCKSIHHLYGEKS